MYQGVVQVPLGSQAWAANFKEAFQAPGASAHTFKLSESGSLFVLEWKTRTGAAQAFECELQPAPAAAHPDKCEQFQEAVPALCVHDTDPELPAHSAPELLTKLEAWQKKSADKEAVVAACAKLLQARTKLINKLQQDLQHSSRRSPDEDDRGVLSASAHACLLPRCAVGLCTHTLAAAVCCRVCLRQSVPAPVRACARACLRQCVPVPACPHTPVRCCRLHLRMLAEAPCLHPRPLRRR